MVSMPCNYNIFYEVFMKELNNVSLFKNGSLNYCKSGAHPKFIDEGLYDTTGVTAIRFSFKTYKSSRNEDVANKAETLGLDESLVKAIAQESDYSEEFYFIGNIVGYDEVKKRFDKIPEDYRDSKFAVTYDDSGNIIDCRVLEKDMHPVQSKEELYEIYFNITGYNFPVSKKECSTENSEDFAGKKK